MAAMQHLLALVGLVLAVAPAMPQPGAAQLLPGPGWPKQEPVLSTEQAQAAVIKKLRTDFMLRLLRDQPDLFKQDTCTSAFKLEVDVKSVSGFMSMMTVTARLRATNALARPIRGPDVDNCFIGMSPSDGRQRDQITLIPGESILLDASFNLTKGFDY
jgi:hypothetical protein